MLIRGIKRETRGSVAFKELTKALDDLTSVFYTEKAQTAFVAGDSIIESKPKEAIEHFITAQRIEEGNLATLKSLARAHLILGDCSKAQAPLTTAEEINPYSAELHLLNLQLLDCRKSHEILATKLQSPAEDLAPLEKFSRGMAMRDLMRKSDLKKARAQLTSWEKEMPDYPETHYWKWQLSLTAGSADRSAAVRYVQACQNLTPRRRKSYILDVDLCKGRVAAENYLKETGMRTTSPKEESEDE